MIGDRPAPSTGPWRAPRELLDQLEGHHARALLDELHEARLELARAAACVAFGIGWFALQVARAPGVIGVVVEVVLVELAAIGAAAVLVGEARRVNARAYARARAHSTRAPATVRACAEPSRAASTSDLEGSDACRTIRTRNLDETAETGPPGAIRSGASMALEARDHRLTARREVGPSELRGRGARELGGRRDRLDVGGLHEADLGGAVDEHDFQPIPRVSGPEPLIHAHRGDLAGSLSHEEALEVVRGGDLVHRPEGYAAAAASASPDRGRAVR